MLEGGEDARFIARRMIVLASEDVGNADPQALLVAVAAAQAVEHVGLPEARLNLAQAAVYLARAPKSNASYLALRPRAADVRERGHLRAAGGAARRPPTAGARKLGRGEGYVYPHDDAGGLRRRLPARRSCRARVYYEPSGIGDEQPVERRATGRRRAALRGSARRARSRRSSTASFAVSFSRSRIGFTSTTLERVEQPRLRDELQREVRLAVGEAAAHRRADAGREHRVDRVEVEADVHERRAREERRARRASTRSMPSRSISLIVKTRDVELREQLALARVERADADERTRASTDGVGQTPAREHVAGRRRARPRAASRGRCRSARSRAG